MESSEREIQALVEKANFLKMHSNELASLYMKCAVKILRKDQSLKSSKLLRKSVCKFCGCIWRLGVMDVKVKSAVPATKHIKKLLKKHEDSVKPREKKLLNGFQKNAVKTIYTCRNCKKSSILRCYVKKPIPAKIELDEAPGVQGKRKKKRKRKRDRNAGLLLGSSDDSLKSSISTKPSLTPKNVNVEKFKGNSPMKTLRQTKPAVKKPVRINQALRSKKKNKLKALVNESEQSSSGGGLMDFLSQV